MTLDDIGLNVLTQSERDVLAEDRERWKRMGAGAHLDEWMAYGSGLLIRRRLAKIHCNTDRAEGKCYNQTFARLMTHDGMDWSDSTVKNSFTAVLWLHDDPERLSILREIRETMTVGERARLNSPISARQRVEKVLKARAGGTEEKLKTSPVAKLKKMNMDLVLKVADLEKQLAAAETRDGSLFDLKRDTPEHIAHTICGTIGKRRWQTIRQAVDAGYKRDEAPAG